MAAKGEEGRDRGFNQSPKDRAGRRGPAWELLCLVPRNREPDVPDPSSAALGGTSAEPVNSLHLSHPLGAKPVRPVKTCICCSRLIYHMLIVFNLSHFHACTS